MVKYRAFSLYSRVWNEMLAGGAKTFQTTSNHRGLTTPTGLFMFLNLLLFYFSILVFILVTGN